MAINKLTLLKTRVKSVKSTIESATPHERSNHASLQTSEMVNKLIADIGDQIPELKESLPEQLRNVGPSARMIAKSDHSFLDLEICVDQLLSLLELVDES